MTPREELAHLDDMYIAGTGDPVQHEIARRIKLLLYIIESGES